MNDSFKKAQDPSFTSTEVGVFIKDLRDDFQIVARGLIGLTGRIDKFEIRLENLEAKVDKFEAKVESIRTNQARTLERITIMEISMNKRFDGLESRIEKLEIARA